MSWSIIERVQGKVESAEVYRVCPVQVQNTSLVCICASCPHPICGLIYYGFDGNVRITTPAKTLGGDICP